MGRPYGPKFSPGFDRLLGDVEQQTATGALRQHDLHGRLRHALVAVEVELEALAQHLLVDLADPALPGRARVRHRDVDAAEGLHHLLEGRAHRGGVGHVAVHRQGRAAELFCSRRRRAFVEIEQRDLRSRRRERLGGRGADDAGGAGDDGDLAGERLLLRGAELGLLERPIFHVEHVGFGDRLEAADRLGVRDDLDRALRDVGCDPGVLLRSPEAEQPEAGHQRDARQRIEHAFLAPPTRAFLRAK